MADHYAISMWLIHGGTPRDLEAREHLASSLPDGDVSPPDEAGVFEVTVEAEDLEDAMRQVWDAVAASGEDDHIVFLEHPALPERWRRHSARP